MILYSEFTSARYSDRMCMVSGTRHELNEQVIEQSDQQAYHRDHDKHEREVLERFVAPVAERVLVDDH